MRHRRSRATQASNIRQQMRRTIPSPRPVIFYPRHQRGITRGIKHTRLARVCFRGTSTSESVDTRHQQIFEIPEAAQRCMTASACYAARTFPLDFANIFGLRERNVYAVPMRSQKFAGDASIDNWKTWVQVMSR